MKIKGLTDEDFVNYKYPSMYICANTCDFKCDKENGVSCCQNSSLASEHYLNVPDDLIIQRYIANKITKAIVFGGLEPFEQFEELYAFIKKLRTEYHCNDTVVIYTGFDYEEIAKHVLALQLFSNIIIKYGRFRPGEAKHYDEVLGIYLASPNQYAEVIS